MADLLKVVLIADAAQYIELLLHVQAAEGEQHHRPNVCRNGGSIQNLFQSLEVLLAANDVLLHALLGPAPDLGRIEGGEEELANLHRRLGCYALLQGTQEKLQAGFGGLAFGGFRLQACVLQFPNGFIGRTGQSGPEVDRGGHLQLILAFSAMVQVPAPLGVLLEKVWVSGKLWDAVPVCLQLSRHHGGPRRKEVPAEAGTKTQALIAPLQSAQ